MRTRILSLAAAGAALVLGGCGAVDDIKYIGSKLSTNKNQDAALVGGGAPLSLPPNYGLRPPAARGRGQTAGTARLSRTVLNAGPGAGAASATTRPLKPGERTPGEAELLRKAGLQGTTTSGVVRKTIDIETKRDSDDRRRFVDRVLKYDPNARGKDDSGKGKDARGRSATLTRPNID